MEIEDLILNSTNRPIQSILDRAVVYTDPVCVSYKKSHNLRNAT